MNYEQLLAKLKVDLFLGPWYTTESAGWIFLAVGVLSLIGFLFWFFPVYGVWSAHKSGLADLAKAQNEQQVQIAVARGRFEAAELNKKAAIIEAEAVAAQIEKIGQNLKQHDLYLKWQWIKMMEDHADSATIYIPTEAGLPILEAGKRGHTRIVDETPADA